MKISDLGDYINNYSCSKYVESIYYYYKRFKFNNFIISQYGLKYKISKFKTLSLFIENESFKFIDTYFRVIITLPLDDLMQTLHNKISKK